MSTLKTGALRGTSGTADSVQLHASDQSVTFPGNVTVSGTATGFSKGITQIVESSDGTNYSNNTAEGALWDLSGILKRDITTTSNSSKVLVFMNLSIGFEDAAGSDIGVQVTRQDGGSGTFDLIAAHNAAAGGNRIRVHTFGHGSGYTNHTWKQGAATCMFLDSPGNAGTYSYSAKLCHSIGSSETIYLNRAHDDTDAIWTQRGSCNIICAELQF